MIGLDIGTTAAKGALVSASGQVLAQAGFHYPLARPRPGWAVQNADDWRRAAARLVRILTAGAPGAVRGIGLSTQGGTLVPVNAVGLPLCGALSWADTRAAAQQAVFEREIGAKAIYELTGWQLCGGLNALQILWLRNNKPDLFNAASQFLSVPGYLTRWLCKRAAEDISSGGIEQLADVRAGSWSEEVLGLLGIGTERLAELVLPDEAAGTLCVEAAQELGLNTDVVVAAGGHDQYCAALGAGIAANQALLATGTAWAALALSDAPRLDENLNLAFGRHVAPGLWGTMLALESGGACLEWLRENTALRGADGALPPLNEVDALAAQSPAGARGLLFYPYFSGSPYPAGGGAALAGFAGLGAHHGPAELARAVMEGVACQAVWMLDALPLPAGAELTLTGGAARSALWAQIVADMARRPVAVPQFADVGCLGAAVLAGAAAGLYTVAQGAAALKTGRRLVTPGPNAPACAQMTARFRAFAQNMRPGGEADAPV